jgi:hypothetical protein
MIKFKNYLAAIALATASLGAFAFSPQSPDHRLQLFANQNGNWVPLAQGEDPTCIRSSEICVAQFKNDDPTGQMVYSKEGTYKP